MDTYEDEFIDNLNKGEIICFYSNKGGVGKTTFVSNFARMIINGDPKITTNIKTILIVDFDNQMNQTAFWMSEKDFEGEIKAQEKYLLLVNSEEKKEDYSMILSSINDPSKWNKKKCKVVCKTKSGSISLTKGCLSFDFIEDELNLAVAQRQKRYN